MGEVPPFDGVAVKVTLVPLQIVPLSDAPIDTIGVTMFDITVSKIPVLVSVLAVWQELFAIITQDITSPFVGV